MMKTTNDWRLLLLLCCSLASAQLEIETIEGSNRKVEIRPRTFVNASKPKETKQFNCIVCDDIRDVNCQPWDKFSHSKNCYNDARIDESKPVGCRWMVQQVQGRTYTSRQCTNLVDDSVQGCVDRVGTKKIKVTYCHCRSPNCNGAARLTVGLSLPLALSLLLLLLQGPSFGL